VFPLDIIEAAARSAEEGCSLQVPHPHKPNFPLTFIGEGNSHAERAPVCPIWQAGGLPALPANTDDNSTPNYFLSGRVNT
jgi:hypothetical protein